MLHPAIDDMGLFNPCVKGVGTAHDLGNHPSADDPGFKQGLHLAGLHSREQLACLAQDTIDIGHRHGIWTGICGGMASDPLMAPLLLGLGVDELSASCSALPMVKDAIRRVSLSEAREIAGLALTSQSSVDVHDMFRELTKKIAPEILELVE